MTKNYLKKVAIIVIIISALLAVILSLLVLKYPVMTIDLNTTKFLQAEGDTPARRAILLLFLRSISYLGVPVISIWMVSITALIFWLLKYYRESIYFLATLLAPVVDAVIKLIIHRPRPDGNGILILDPQRISSSFPSGHVMFYTVFFGLLFTTMFFVKKIPKWTKYLIITISLALIILISLSRVYLGAHWVTDTIGGYLFGFIFLSILLYFYLKKLVKIETELQ